MLIPEIILFNTIKAFVQLITQDYANASDKTQTILNDLFNVDNNGNPLQLQNFNYLEQAIALFTRTIEHPRQFQVNIGYNLQRANFPTVHILLPQEVPGRYDSIGLSIGEIDTVYHPEANPQYEQETRVTTYRANFDLMITSDNTSEVLLVYYLLKDMFPFASDTLELLGLHNFKLTGQDVQLDAAYAPANIFHRSLRTEFDYQSETIVRNNRDMANKLNFMICSSIGDDNKGVNNPPPTRQQVSDNFIITVNKTNQTGIVGFVRFINKLDNNQEALIQIDVTGQPNTFEISAGLTPANYKVEVNLTDYLLEIDGVLTDGVHLEFDFNSNGQNSFYKVFDLVNVGSGDILLTLNFM